MSYTRPKFIREDYGAFNRNMQASFKTSFTEMKDYFDNKIKEREEYVTDVNAQAEEMRTEGTNIEEFATKTQEQIEEEVQKFISSALTVTDKEGRSVDDKDFKAGFFSQHIDEKKMSKRKMDEVNASFTNSIKGQDAITEEAFVKMLDLHDDYDKNSPGYQKFAGAIAGLRGGWKEGGHMKVKFDEKTGKFTSNLAIPNPDYEPKMIGGKPNPRWYEGVNEGVDEEVNYTSGELQSLLAGNDSSLRTNHEEAVHGEGGVIQTIKGQVLTDRGSNKASGEAYVAGTLGSEEGAAYLAPTMIKANVQKFMAESRASNENNPDSPSIIDGIFANNVNFNTNLRLDLLGGGETEDGETIEGVEGGAELIALVEGITPKDIYSGIVTPNEAGMPSVHTNTKIQAQEILADVLDMPAGDIKNRKKDLARLYDLTNPGGSAEDKQKWIDAQEKVVKNFRDAASERYITNELLAEGIGSEYIKGRKKDPTPTGTGSGGGGKPPKIDHYSFQQAGEATNTMNVADSVIKDVLKSDSFLEGTVVTDLSSSEMSEEQQAAYNELNEEMTGRTFTYGGSKVPVKDFTISSDGTMRFTFEKGSAITDIYDDSGNKTGEKEAIDFTKESDTFNIYNPEDMRNFYKVTSPEAGTSSDYTRDFSSVKYDKNMIQHFFEDPDPIAKLADPNYEKWFDFIDDKGVDRNQNNSITSQYGKYRLAKTILDNKSYWQPGGANYNEKIAGWKKSNDEWINKMLMQEVGFD